jgi:hypothetical protein
VQQAAIERSTEVPLPWPVEFIASEFYSRFGPHLVHAKADLLKDFGDASRSLPEANVASLAHETTDQILAATDRREGIGKNEGGTAHLLVSEESFLAPEIIQTRLKGRRVGQREVSIFPQRPKAHFLGNGS